MAEDFYDVSVMGSYAELHERGMGRRLRGGGDDASRGRRRVTWEDESERPSARGRGRDRGESGDVSASSSAARDDDDDDGGGGGDGDDADARARGRGRGGEPSSSSTRCCAWNSSKRVDGEREPSSGKPPRSHSSSRERSSTAVSLLRTREMEPARHVVPMPTPRGPGEPSSSSSGGDDRDRPSTHRHQHVDAVRRHLAKPVSLSALLRDAPCAFDPTKSRISVVDKRLSIIDAVPPAYRPTQRLYASHNRIASLAGLAQFRELRLLSAGDNPIDDIPQLDALARGCPHLEALSLELTPVSRLPFYRAHVLARMPRLKSLDGKATTREEIVAAPGRVRRDVRSLEMLMSAAVTAAKLRRAYALSLVHQELREVVFSANGPVDPRSFPSRADRAGADVVDPRTFLKLCQPERTMTASEVAALAKSLRVATALEAKRISTSNDDRGTSVNEEARWEAAYAAALAREQTDTAALLSYLDDANARTKDRREASVADPFATALRWGFEAAAAREVEVRSDREAALTDIMDNEAAASYRFGEILRGDAPAAAPAAETSRVERPRTPTHRRERRDEREEVEDFRLDDDDDDDDDDDGTFNVEEAWVNSDAVFDERLDDDADAIRRGRGFSHGATVSARRHSSAPPSPTGRARERAPPRPRPRARSTSRERVPGAGYAWGDHWYDGHVAATSTATATAARVKWGYGPGTAAAAARETAAAKKRVGDAAMAAAERGRGRGRTRTPRSRDVSRDVSPSNGRGWDSLEGARRSAEMSRGDASPAKPERQATTTTRQRARPYPPRDLYDMLSQEVDALRTALESHAAGETELLAANAELRRRVEAAEGDVEKAKIHGVAAAAEEAARAAHAVARARADAHAAEAREKEAAERLRTLEAERETAAKAAAAAARKIADATEEAETLRRTLAALEDAERKKESVDAMASRNAGKKALRMWRSRVAASKVARVLAYARRRRAAQWALTLWMWRTRAQRRLRVVYERQTNKVGVVVMRKWRFAVAVAAVTRCLRRRRALRRWARNVRILKDTRDAWHAQFTATWSANAAARVFDAWRRASRSTKSLAEYSDALLRASNPRLHRARDRTALASALSAWHLEVTRSQRARMEHLAETCDGLAAAASEAAEAASGVERANNDLTQVERALRSDARTAEMRADAWEKQADVEAAERREAQDEVERLRERVHELELEIEERTRGAESANWRVAFEAGERAILAAGTFLEQWALELQREKAHADRVKNDAKLDIAFLRSITEVTPGSRSPRSRENPLKSLPVRARELHDALEAHAAQAAAMREQCEADDARRKRRAATASRSRSRREGSTTTRSGEEDDDDDESFPTPVSERRWPPGSAGGSTSNANGGGFEFAARSTPAFRIRSRPSLSPTSRSHDP